MNKLRQYTYICVIGFIIALIYHYFLGAYFGYSWPFNSFLFTPSDKFMDFFNVINFSKYLLEGQSVYGHEMWNAYMPFSNIAFIPFAIGGKILNLLIYAILVVGCFFAFVKKKIFEIEGEKQEKQFLTIIFLLTAYPFLFLLDRANLEGITLIFLIFFIILYEKKRFVLAILILGVLINIKPFAIVFIVLFISDKRYKELIFFFILLFSIFSLSLLVLPGGFEQNFKGFLEGTKIYNKNYVDGILGIQYSHSLFIPIQIINNLGLIQTSFSKIVYFVLAIIIFLVVSSFILRFEVAYWEKVFVLTLCMVGLPFASADYTLTNLYIPLLMFFSSNNKLKNENLFILITALLMIPKQYYLYKDFLNLSMILNPILIILLILIILQEISYRKQTKKIQVNYY